MKLSILLITLILLARTALPQNVGIGETNPLVKLTVKSTGVLPSLLVKNGDDDSLILTTYRNIGLGGYHAAATGVVTISNKHYLPLDPAQLELVAAGERSGIDANGSLNTIRFSNANSNKFFSISSYTGGSAADRNFALSHYDPDDGTGAYRSLIYFKPDGRTGIGTYQPNGRLQINHTAGVGSPTLNLLDSSGISSPIIQFGNRGGSDYWQLRGTIASGSPTATFLDFATQAGARMTLRGDGNLGLGISNPGAKLDVSGNVRVTGEVNRTSTGAANLVPVAYGTVQANGGITSGSGNFTVNHFTTGFYDITITGENYIYSVYSTIVTPVYSTTPVIAGTGSGSGRLQVYINNITGADTDSIFSFVVYKQ